MSCGSGSAFIFLPDPNPHSICRSGSKREKLKNNNRKNAMKIVGINCNFLKICEVNLNQLQNPHQGPIWTAEDHLTSIQVSISFTVFYFGATTSFFKFFNYSKLFIRYCNFLSWIRIRIEKATGSGYASKEKKSGSAKKECEFTALVTEPEPGKPKSF